MCDTFLDFTSVSYPSFVSDQKGMEYFELLVRSLLDRPDQPAVVILGHFSPQIHNVHGFAGPDHWHNIVAQFYDVPHIRYVLLSQVWETVVTLLQRETHFIPYVYDRPRPYQPVLCRLHPCKF